MTYITMKVPARLVPIEPGEHSRLVRCADKVCCLRPTIDVRNDPPRPGQCAGADYSREVKAYWPSGYGRSATDYGYFLFHYNYGLSSISVVPANTPLEVDLSPEEAKVVIAALEAEDKARYG